MGDLMHALPAITEAKLNMPNLVFDWVVDKNFSSVPKWHPAINEVIETNHREWKLNLFSSDSRNEIKQVIETIEDNNYDLIVDMQNNLKSAFLSFLCKQPVAGMDARSSREYPAHLAYKKKINVSKDMHAIQRQKSLLSSALDYSNKISVDSYGIDKNKFSYSNKVSEKKYIVCVQNASWPTKQWPINYWQELICELAVNDMHLYFPSGNQSELDRANEICSASPKAKALDLMSLNEMAYLIDNASLSICSDTGLAHLSAITNTPSLTLYGPTNPQLIGTYGEDQHHLLAKNSNITNISVNEVMSKLKDLALIEF